MHYYILIDLGKEKINAVQAGLVYDLMSGVETAGTTHCQGLANNDYYKRAVQAWVQAKKIHRQRLIESKTF